MKIFNHILIHKIKWHQTKLEHEATKLDNQNLEASNKQLNRENRLLKELLDIEQQNTRMNK